MHRLKKFIAYFVVFVIAFFIGMFFEKLMNSFYPNQKKSTEPILIVDEEDMAPVIQQEEIITADTKLITIENNLKTGEVIRGEQNIPIKYIGLNRAEFLEEMEVYETSPALSDMKKGFKSLEVLSFSNKQIELQKNYLYEENKVHYYILAKDNKLIVYYDDLQTVYLTTDITLDSLPEKVQLEILHMKYFETEEELYNFLESYSS